MLLPWILVIFTLSVAFIGFLVHLRRRIQAHRHHE